MKLLAEWSRGRLSNIPGKVQQDSSELVTMSWKAGAGWPAALSIGAIVLMQLAIIQEWRIL